VRACVRVCVRVVHTLHAAFFQLKSYRHTCPDLILWFHNLEHLELLITSTFASCSKFGSGPVPATKRTCYPRDSGHTPDRCSSDITNPPVVNLAFEECKRLGFQNSAK